MTNDLQSKRSWSSKRIYRHAQDEQMDDSKVFPALVVVLCLLTAVILVVCASFAQAAGIPEDVAVRVLIGEASNQGEHGMVCVAEVLRKRGSTNGFYGLKAKHVDAQPSWVWDQARRAWRTSASTNYTQGATHFENIKAFGVPSWAKKMDVVYQHKAHTFYRERRG